MKTLYLLRHAKSSWDNSAILDFDRPLNKRGLETAPFIGKVIYDKQIQPDLILSSPAKRAKHTAILVKETAQLSAQIKYEEKIYEASRIKLVEIISDLEEEFKSVLLVGHNPGLECFTNYFTDKMPNIPTACLLKININVEKWSEIAENCGEIDFIIRPKDEFAELSVS
jgi:phosphohistidine phosphatase